MSRVNESLFVFVSKQTESRLQTATRNLEVITSEKQQIETTLTNTKTELREVWYH